MNSVKYRKSIGGDIMFKYKRLIAIGVIISVFFSMCLLAGCGKEKEPAEKTVTVEKENTEKEQEKQEEKEQAEKEDEEAEKEAEPEPEPAPEPEPEPAPEPEPEPEPENDYRYYLTVNCTSNVVTVYERGENGKFNKPVKAMTCSSGLDSTPTPEGYYHLTGNRWEWLDLVGGVSGMYVTQFYGDYLFHSVPYTERGNHGSLQEGEYDKLGQDASHGCVRLAVKDAKWIYDNMWDIVGVRIFNSEKTGPLGKPETVKIGDSSHPGWDPTDSDSDNPWNN